MRKTLFVVGVFAALAIAPAALAANVTISALGFVPASVTINQGDAVTWTNTDVATHQVVSKKAGLSSPVLSTGQTYSFVFKKAGSFGYQDALDKAMTGTVVVQAVPAPKPAPKPAPALSLTLSASTLQVVYGGAVTLSGAVSNKQAGEQVTVLAERYGQSSFARIARVTSSGGGHWSYTARPGIRVGYQARLQNATSPTATIGVHPLVSLHVLTGRRLSTKVAAARSFAGRYVQLQRKSSLGQWVTIKRLRLDSNSAATFRAPTGTSTLRSAISINQAGAGYLGGTSRTIVYAAT